MPWRDTLLPLLTLLALLGSGLMAGVFFAFSAFVMRALLKLPTPSAIAAMQSINLVVLNPLFLGVFIGTAIFSVILAIAALLRLQTPGSGVLLIACLLYLIGTFGVTAAANVPLNEGLALVAADAPDAADRWHDYTARWTRWNLVRTLAATLATAGFAWALRVGVTSSGAILSL